MTNQQTVVRIGVQEDRNQNQNAGAGNNVSAWDVMLSQVQIIVQKANRSAGEQLITPAAAVATITQSRGIVETEKFSIMYNMGTNATLLDCLLVRLAHSKYWNLNKQLRLRDINVGTSTAISTAPASGRTATTAKTKINFRTEGGYVETPNLGITETMAKWVVHGLIPAGYINSLYSITNANGNIAKMTTRKENGIKRIVFVDQYRGVN